MNAPEGALSLPRARADAGAGDLVLDHRPDEIAGYRRAVT